MSTQIPTHFVKAFERGIMHLAEQKESRLRPHVRVEMLSTGDRSFFDQVGSVTAQPVTTRHADTPLTDTPHSRRMVIPVPYKHADLIDKTDMIRTLNDPTNAYVTAFGRAFGRAMDDVIVAAAFATAKTGVDGSTSSAFDTVGYQIASSSVGLTLGKLTEANKKLRAAENDPDDGFRFAVSQEQIEDMLNDSTFTSADYNAIRALMTGEINTFMGFTWVALERLGTDGSGDRRCIAWAKNTLLLGMAAEPSTRISERDDKNYSTQVFMSMDLGATRMEETGVVEVLCSE